MTEYAMPWLWDFPEGAQCLGKRGFRHQDHMMKVSGRGLYAHDVYFPGMLYAKCFECPYPHAKIKSMDTSKAEALPGVKAVIRYDDPNIDWTTFYGCPMAPARYNGFLALSDEGYFQYQAVGAIVVTDSELICDEALRLIEVDWEILPYSLDLGDEALQPGYPILFPDRSPDTNLQMEQVEQYGDVEAGLAEAPNVIEVEFTHEPDIWAGVEGGCAVASWKGDSRVELWPHCQHPAMGASGFMSRLAAALGLKANLACAGHHQMYNGATFGGTYGGEGDYQCEYYATLASMITGKPVKFIWDNGGDWLSCGEDLGTYRMKIGYKDNGEVTAVKYHCLLNMNLYDQPNKLHKGSKVPNIYCLRQYPWQNHGPYNCYKHGDGAVLCHNEPFNQVAAALEMDPTEVALINDGCYEHSMEWVNENVKEPQGFDPTRDSLREILEVGKAAIDWDNKWHLPGTKVLPNGNYHGIGFVQTISWSHSSDTSDPGASVGCRLESDGTVAIIAQRNDTGQCSEMGYCIAVADEVGVKYEDVFYSNKEYSGYYVAYPAGATNTVLNLSRIVTAARNLKKLILKAAISPGSYGQPPAFPDKTTDELDIKNGEIFEKANPDNKVPVAAVAGTRPFAWNYDQPICDVKQYVMVRQCYFVEVEVDPETGKVHLKKVVHVYDCGKCISPATMEGQLYGGIYMGLGVSNTEQKVYDPQTGAQLNDNHINYGIALANDIEEVPDVHYVETGLAYGAYGLCGCSEAQKACTASSTRYAVHNAIGKWVDLKTTPEKILKALGKI